MPDYKNGCVYKIISGSTDKIYIGSTTSKLERRLAEHRYDYKRYLNGSRKTAKSHEILKHGDYQIILIENISCENKKELESKERFYIEQNKDICVNCHIPTRTHKEWAEQHKDEMIKYRKDYYLTNKDKIKEWSDDYYKKNREHKLEYNKKYASENKDKIIARWKQKIACECGDFISYTHISRHKLTKSHLSKLNKA